MALLLFFFFLYSLTLRISLHLSPSRGKCWKGRLQKNQKKQKNKTLKTWKIGEVVSFPFWASDPAFLACPFSYSILCSLPYSWTHHPSCILFFFWSLHLSMSYDSIFLFFCFSFYLHFHFPSRFPPQVPCIVLPGHSEWVLVCLCMSYYSLIGNSNEHDLIFSYLPSKYSTEFVF